ARTLSHGHIRGYPKSKARRGCAHGSHAAGTTVRRHLLWCGSLSVDVDLCSEITNCEFSVEQWLLSGARVALQSERPVRCRQKRRDTLWQSGRRKAHEHCEFCSWDHEG